MGARNKLNVSYFNGSLFLAGLVGWLTCSIESTGSLASARVPNLSGWDAGGVASPPEGLGLDGCTLF